MHWLAHDFGTPGPSTPLNTRLMKEVAADPKATQMLLRMLNHEVRPSQLFTTRLVARAAARALRDRPDRLTATLKEIVSAGRRNARRSRQGRVAPWSRDTTVFTARESVASTLRRREGLGA